MGSASSVSVRVLEESAEPVAASWSSVSMRWSIPLGFFWVTLYNQNQANLRFTPKLICDLTVRSQISRIGEEIWFSAMSVASTTTAAG